MRAPASDLEKQDSPPQKDNEAFLSQAPTPREQKSSELSSIKENGTQVSDDHQRQITQRLFGSPKSEGEELKSSENIYIGDLVKDIPGGVSTDQSEDSEAISDKLINCEEPNNLSMVAQGLGPSEANELKVG